MSELEAAGNRIIKAIDAQIKKLKSDQVKLGYDPAAYDAIQDEIAEIKKTNGKIFRASMSGSDAKLRSALREAIGKHDFLARFTLPGDSSASTAPPSAGRPDPTPPPRATTEEEEVCPICLDTLNNGTPIHTGPCGHKLHKSCYDRLPSPWTSGPKTGQKACPLCRYNAVDPSGALGEPLLSQRGFGKPKRCKKCGLMKY